MYRTVNIKKLLRLFALDTVVIIFLLIFTNTSGCFKTSGVGSEERIFVPIIMYHSILDCGICDYVVTPDEIESDLKYLKDSGYNTVLVEDLINYVYYDYPLPEKPVVITLDDGNYNNLYYLVPLLEKYDMCAVISVVGSYTAASEVDKHKPRYSYLVWEDIRELLDTGRIEIGNHTYNMHSSSPRKGCSIKSYEAEEDYAKALFADVGQLQSLMNKNTGYTPVTFAYPFGFLCPESIPVLKELGFKATLTCRERPNFITKDENCLYGLDRYNRPGGMSTEKFMSKALKIS